MKDLDLGILFFVQIAIILVACRGFGWLFKKFLGQAQVVSEMAVGVILGPSVFGAFWPHTQEKLFPQFLIVNGVQTRHPSMQVIYILSQIGLTLYMFLVGLEFNTDLLKSRAKGAIAVSLSGMIAPFVLGGAFALYLYRRGDCFTPMVSWQNAALYTGAAMCITAFPMLARILFEKGIARTRMGTLALGAGATDDAMAWTLLAIVLAATKGDSKIAVWAIGGGAAYGILMATVGKRVFTFFERWTEKERSVTLPIYATVLTLLMLCAGFTDAIGIYAVFGAFIFGAVLPRGEFAEGVRARTENLTVTLLLPTFFVFSGLNTKIGLLNSPELWLITLAIIVIAVAGKGVACMLAARWSGESWRESATIGVLMNSRGLMELIIVNIALQQGVITPTFFAMMVIMAIFTTVIASPLFEWIYGAHVAKEVESSNAALAAT